MGVASKEI
jgi:hypothetical protein